MLAYSLIRPSVVLLSGETVCSWSAAWRAETLARHSKAATILLLPDREARRAALDVYQRNAAAFAATQPSCTSPDAYAAEARCRMEAAILDAWRRQQALAA